MKTTIRIDAAATEYDADGNLWLTFRIPIEYRQAARGIERVVNETQKIFGITFAPFRKKRSLDANAYYWKLCGELAKVLNESPEAIYRKHIAELGIYETLCMETKAVPSFARMWKSGHIGRLIGTRVSKLVGCTTVLAYHGSSDFDTKQMSRLIDNCIQDCREQGIETATPQELQRLKEGWK